MKQMIEAKINNKSYSVACGSTVEDLLIAANFSLSKNYQEDPIIAARVNFELQPLTHKITFNAAIEPIRLFSSQGKRIYRHSICYLLAYASNEVFPTRRLKIGHSLGDGYYYHYDDKLILNQIEIDKLSAKMKELVEKDIPIEQIKISYNEAIEYFQERNEGDSQTAALLKTNPSCNISLYKSNNFIDGSLEPLVYTTKLLSLWELRPYQSTGMLLRYPRSSDFTVLQPFKDNSLLFSVFKEYRKWNSILEMESVGQLNTYSRQGKIADYIRLAETLQWKKISAIADDIEDNSNVKIVFIAGPSSSGKTTFTNKLAINLKVLGKKPILISLDNYYKTIDLVPTDEDGNKDFECLESLDIEQFQQDIAELFEGNEIEFPTFNFIKNKREYFGNKVKFEKNTILLIEGIHGLNPKLLPNIEEESTYKVYISALTQLNLDDHNRISTTDNRILRRIARDSMTRGVSANTTLEMWSSVEAGENKHIFPFQNNANVMLNSAIDYELGALKQYCEPLLKTIEPSDSEAYAIARRLLMILDKVHTIPSILVPRDSLIREFIGGSEFHVT